MVNRPLADGTRGEVAIVRTLKPYYPMVERRAKEGFRDRGDIGGVYPRLVIESKHAPRSYDISGWLREVDREMVNDNADVGVCWFKIKGTTDPLDWPVMMRGRVFLPLLRKWTGHDD